MRAVCRDAAAYFVMKHFCITCSFSIETSHIKSCGAHTQQRCRIDGTIRHSFEAVRGTRPFGKRNPGQRSGGH